MVNYSTVVRSDTDRYETSLGYGISIRSLCLHFRCASVPSMSRPARCAR